MLMWWQQVNGKLHTRSMISKNSKEQNYKKKQSYMQFHFRCVSFWWTLWTPRSVTWNNCNLQMCINKLSIGLWSRNSIHTPRALHKLSAKKKNYARGTRVKCAILANINISCKVHRLMDFYSQKTNMISLTCNH